MHIYLPAKMYAVHIGYDFSIQLLTSAANNLTLITDLTTDQVGRPTWGPVV